MSVRSLSAEAVHSPVVSAAAEAYDLTAGRVGSVAAALLGVAAVAIGVLALRARDGASPTRARTALGLGLAGAAAGAVLAATADGGPGSGSGIVGSVVAVLVGLGGAALGWRALARTRRAR
ncbi:hypothetical protein SRB5_05760 [Streptomyces sp. RB5]|uniref:Uncharacterized protein n=1 Tax=Streptomyces smaragdinus TaxID=2585196 RepID=A0A7K0CAM5_9ACTN|nr:DUF6223 family protein [Streptomyces smaragdinus]MQY10468.1 hypothetical protein [Streptomyces smaragdinus]